MLQDPWTPERVHDYLDRHIGREPGTKIQYGHPSPRFWLPAALEPAAALAARSPDRPLNLYLHIPFCPPTDPDACGFCLFAREDYTSQRAVDAYVDDMLLELAAIAAQLGRQPLETLYFGGGTPNVLSESNVRRIFEALRAAFEIDQGCEITFEGTPALFTESRLRVLRDVGVTRISIGAQTLDPALIAYSGRQQRPEQIERTVAFCREHDIRVSVDLITGWFEQSPEHVVRDIESLAAWGADGIVNHPLTLGGDSDFARRRHELPSVEVTMRSFLAARERLLELGYRADGYTDYRRESLPPVRFLEMYRDVMCHDRVGIGYGANSLFAGSLEAPGHTYRNVVGRSAYHERVVAGGPIVDLRFGYEAVDLVLLHVLKGLEGTPWLSEARYAEQFGSDLRADFAPWWQALQERGWLVWQDGGPRLVGEGIFYTSEIQRCISAPRNAALRL